MSSSWIYHGYQYLGLLVEVSGNGDGALCALYAGIRTPNPNSLVGRGGCVYPMVKLVRSNPVLRIATIKFGQ